jgi:hypothetical protein
MLSGYAGAGGVPAIAVRARARVGWGSTPEWGEFIDERDTRNSH